jgi:hypothetical protein
VGPLVFDREDRDADAAGVEADGVAEGAGHSGGLTAAVAAGEQAGQVPGVEDGGVWPDEDDRGGQNGADVLALRHPGDQLAGDVGDEDVALADARAEYLVVGDVVFLRWGKRPDQVASGDDGPADLREAALLNDSRCAVLRM